MNWLSNINYKQLFFSNKIICRPSVFIRPIIMYFIKNANFISGIWAACGGY